MSITTNAALRDRGEKPHFTGSLHDQFARCTRCDQATHVDGLRFVGDVKGSKGEPPLFYNRVEALLRCCACDHVHWVVAMPRDSSVALDFFVDDAK
jgi:hypothetical protein